MTDLQRGFRDAIHVPFIIVSCDSELQPGDKISLRHDDKCVLWQGSNYEPDWHGVAEPFRLTKIPAGELFACFIRKDCFSGLTHNFKIEVNDHGGTDTCHKVCDIF